MIWNFRLMPARERAAGVACVMSLPRKVTVPAVGVSAPAIDLSNVLFPEPFGPISPWKEFPVTVRSTPPSAVSVA